MSSKIDERYIWLNAEILHACDAKINILSPMAQYGLNVFEGIRCYWNSDLHQLYAFRLEDHYRRLLDSAKMLRLKHEYSVDYLQKSFVDIIRANHYEEDIAVRQTIFVDGFGNWAAAGPVGMFIAPIPKGPILVDTQGYHCGISTWERISDKNISPKIKAGANYINSRYAQLEAMQNGYDTALLTDNNGNITESCGSCVCIVKNGQLITPPAYSSILDSITRKTIILLANNVLGIRVIEREITRMELYVADEVFLCGSAVEIIPVLSVDRLQISSGQPGDITMRILALYKKIVIGGEPEYSHMLTPLY